MVPGLLRLFDGANVSEYGISPTMFSFLSYTVYETFDLENFEIVT